jgi:16S rRNA pseudouridine516 synthase
MVSLQRQRLWQRLTEAGIPAAAQQSLLDTGRLRLAYSDADSPALKLSHWLSTASELLLDGIALPAVPARRYWAYHKPVGIDCNVRTDDPHSIASILQTLPAGVFAVGRLDKDSCGLLLLTNDGQFAQRLLHPDQHHQKTYLVQLDKALSLAQLQQLQDGLLYQAGPLWEQARPCQATQSPPAFLHITLTEGKHRQIRYMCKQLGTRVLRLERLSIGRLTLSDLPSGGLQELTGDQVALAADWP